MFMFPSSLYNSFHWDLMMIVSLECPSIMYMSSLVGSIDWFGLRLSCLCQKMKFLFVPASLQPLSWWAATNLIGDPLSVLMMSEVLRALLPSYPNMII